MDYGHILQMIALFAIPAIFAITLHEAAHGYAARYFGDPTALQAGRISLNPVRHIDPFGTLLVPAMILFFSKGQFAFGWAKPVPVNFGLLRNPRRDMFWVAAAGPGANLFMALLWALLIKVLVSAPSNYFSEPLLLMAQGGIIINVVLMVLNLLPLPPLDGGRIAVSLLPHRVGYAYSRVEPYGLLILLVLLFTGVLWTLMNPFIDSSLRLIAWLVGL